ncbi:MAG: hypothetical protein KDI79_15335 [Anaerolineae bacterium]|nr:hypothetical protein [Anaerolineae bacterium]
MALKYETKTVLLPSYRTVTIRRICLHTMAQCGFLPDELVDISNKPGLSSDEKAAGYNRLLNLLTKNALVQPKIPPDQLSIDDKRVIILWATERASRWAPDD